MSEKIEFKSSMEHGMSFEALASQEKSGEHKAESQQEKKHVEQVEKAAQEKAEAEARSVIEEAAKTKEEVSLPAETEPAESGPMFIDKAAKALKFKQNLRQVRAQLPATSRALSRIVHQPAIRVVSEASAKTITRPSGLFGGGVFAFLGSAGYLYITKHVGVRYNYFAFLVFFAGGFAVGLLLELIMRVLRPQPQE